MAHQPLNIGIVGAGANTRARHIPLLQSIEGVSITAVCNRSEASAREAAREFGIPRVFADWRELVASEGVDAVVIGTWPNMHCPVTVAALDAGKHVLCEARMAMDLAEAREMLAAAARNPGLITQVVPSPFTLGVDRTVRRLLAEGAVGPLLVIEVKGCAETLLDREAPLTWRQDRALSGLNVLTMGIWYEALMRWVGEAVSVSASARVFADSRPDPDSGLPREVTVPDHLDIVAEMEIGAQAHLQFSSVLGAAGGNVISLVGEQGVLRLADGMLSICGPGGGEFQAVDIPAEEAGAWRVEAEFIGAIRGDAPVALTTFADGVRYMAFTQAVADSLASGATERVWRE